jgi:hypothetical protein
MNADLINFISSFIILFFSLFLSVITKPQLEVAIMGNKFVYQRRNFMKVELNLFVFS